MNTSILVGVASLVIGGVGGYLTGASGSGQPEEQKSEVRHSSKAARLMAASGGGETARRKSGMSLEEIRSEPGQSARMQKLLDFYANLDPTKFGEEAEKLGDLPFGERMMAGYLLFSRWAEVDPQAALAFTDSMGRAGFMVKGTVLQSWASTDPQGAARYFEQNPDDFRRMGGFGGRGSGAASQIASEWARQDPDAALAWAKGLDGRDASSAIGGIFRQVAGEDPAKAAQMALTLDDEERAGAYRSIAREWGKQDWSAAESWISGLPSGEQDAARAQAIRGLAGENPALAAQKVASLAEGDGRSEAIRSVAENWSQRDPAAAADWLVQQQGEEISRSMRDVMSNWVGQDREAALDFVNAQPEGDMRDSAASNYVFSNRGGDAQESLTLAESISDEGSRSRAVGVAAIRWAQEDTEAAVEYVQNSMTLSADAKERIIERASGGGDDRRGRGGPGGRGGRGGR